MNAQTKLWKLRSRMTDETSCKVIKKLYWDTMCWDCSCAF